MVWAVTTLLNGDVVVAGDFTIAGGVVANRIARWDGTAWSPLGTGMNAPVAALTVLPDGDLVAGGSFTSAGGVAASHIARWNGTVWAPSGGGFDSLVLALHVLPSGDLVAGGGFVVAGGVSAPKLARWNGTSWSPLAGGANDTVRGFASLPNGDLLAVGNFTAVGETPSASLATLTTTCPAAATPAGAGCTGSGGANVLTAVTLPWTGATFRAVASGLAVNSLALGVRGLATTSVPLANILPQGLPGCSLLVTTDLVDLYMPTAGSVAVAFGVPSSAALVGQTLHQQVVSLELGALSSIAALSSTNALRLTIGSF
jgi:hypothetical protein